MVARLHYLRLCLFEMYVNVVFVIRCLYSAVSLILVKEQRLIRIIIVINVVDICIMLQYGTGISKSAVCVGGGGGAGGGGVWGGGW